MSRRSDREGIAPELLSNPFTPRGTHTRALAYAAVERSNGLKGQARMWIKQAQRERWCPYHKAFDRLPPLPN